MNYSLIEYPDPMLLTRCAPVDVPEDMPIIAELVENMKAVCEKHKAYGLAANQLGINAQVIVYRETSGGALQALINPVIIDFSTERTWGKEGCLSMPGMEIRMLRSDEIEVTANNLDGEVITIIAEGLEARTIQHEVDHLAGKCIIDSLKGITRKLAFDKFLKTRKQYARREIAMLKAA
jgi:peptide deformylase